MLRLTGKFPSRKLLFILSPLFIWHARLAASTITKVPDLPDQLQALVEDAQYAAALEKMKQSLSQKSPPPQDIAPLAYYWAGIAASRLSEFDQAVPFFKQAMPVAASIPAIYYEIGQALYAMQDLRAARKQFELAKLYGYKTQASLYYIGYTSLVLEEEDAARRSFLTIIRSNDDTDTVLQPAMMTLAKMEFDIAQKLSSARKRNQAIRETVIPLFQKTIDYNPDDELSQEAKPLLTKALQLIGELKEYPQFTNGVPLDPTSLSLVANATVGYDSNPAYLGNASTTYTNSQKQSFLGQGNLFAKKNYIFSQLAVFSPEASITGTWYSNISNTTIESLKGFLVSAALRLRFEEKVLSKPAATQLDWDYSDLLYDTHGNGKLIFYGKTNRFGLSQKVNYFRLGPTQVSLYYQFLNFATGALNGFNSGFIFTQTLAPLPVLFFNVGGTVSHTQADSTLYCHSDKKISVSAWLFEAIPNWRFFAGFDYTIVDTLSNRPDRGEELTSAFSLSVFHILSTTQQIAANFVQSSNQSLDQATWAYKRTYLAVTWSTYF